MLATKPEKLNEDPHGAAWLIKVRVANDGRNFESDVCRRLSNICGGGKLSLRYLPKSDIERREMLAACGINKQISYSIRFRRRRGLTMR